MRATALIAALALAGVMLLGREAAPDDWAMPAALRAALALVLAGGAVWLSLRARQAGARAMMVCLAALAAAAGLELAPVQPNTD